METTTNPIKCMCGHERFFHPWDNGCRHGGTCGCAAFSDPEPGSRYYQRAQADATYSLVQITLAGYQRVLRSGLTHDEALRLASKTEQAGGTLALYDGNIYTEVAR